MKIIMIYQEDVCEGAYIKQQLKHKMEPILKKINEAVMIINNDKCGLNCDKYSSIGY